VFCCVTGNRDEPILNLSASLCGSADMDRVCYDKCHGLTVCVYRAGVRQPFFLTLNPKLPAAQMSVIFISGTDLISLLILFFLGQPVPTRSSVIADRTAYRTYCIAAEPNHRLINLYTVQTDRQQTHS